MLQSLEEVLIETFSVFFPHSAPASSPSRDAPLVSEGPRRTKCKIEEVLLDFWASPFKSTRLRRHHG